MEFARKQLEKYGWSDGKGLGKHENGISEALKPKLKRSMTGIGHDAAADFTEHWWSALYDKAASNIEVKEKNGSTKKIKAKDDTGFEITNSTWKLKKKPKPTDDKPPEQYKDFFVRTVVLGSGGRKTERVRESESEDEVPEGDVFKMTDEDLYAACEGRTAHKGARHGLKALGKLARIEKQEQLLLQQSKYNGYSHRKNKQTKDEDNDREIFETTGLMSDEVVETKKRKKKKKKYCSRKDNSGSEDIPNSEDISTVKKKKKNREHLKGGDEFKDITSEANKPMCEDMVMDDIENDNVERNLEFKEKKGKKSKKVKLECDSFVTDIEKPKKRIKVVLRETEDPIENEFKDITIEVKNPISEKMEMDEINNDFLKRNLEFVESKGKKSKKIKSK